MKAYQLNECGAPENLKLTEVDKPAIKSNEVLIETKAISINPVDYKVRTIDGLCTAIYGEERPAILGWDISGLVTEIGSDVDSFEVGDRVFGMVNFVGAGKVYAEYVASPADHIAKIPENISFEEAAGTTLAALTALQVMRDKVKEGNRILIHAGSGGVGHYAIQMAKSMGAYVISTSSAKNKDFIMSLGADEHIDYNSQDFREVLSDIDFVFDMFNGEILFKSVQLVSEGGTVISIPSPEFSDKVQALAKEKNVHLAFQMVQSSGSDMSELAEMLSSGKLRAHISEQFSFEDMVKAHKHIESGRTVGKIVVKV